MNSLRKDPFLHALRRWGRFARNVSAAKRRRARRNGCFRRLMNKKVWCTIFFFLTGSRCRGRWIFESHECLNILRELGLNFFVCDWKVWDPFKRNCHKLQAYGRVHLTTTVIRLTVCFRLLSIRHRHNSLCPPILKVKRRRGSLFRTPVTNRKRKSQLWRPYGGRIIFPCRLFFSDQEPWPTYSQEEVPLYISVME